MSDLDVPSWVMSVAAGVRNPHNWLATAESLKRASDLLRQTWLDDGVHMREGFRLYATGEASSPWPPWVGFPAMTLAAFSVENLLKGIRIAADESLVQPDSGRPEELLDPKLRTHELVLLADHAGVNLSTEERLLLQRLTEFVRWAGRYPFPLNAMAAAPRPGAESGGSSFTSAWFPTLDGLFDRLRSELFEAGTRADRQREAAVHEEKRRQRTELIGRLDSLRRIEVEPGLTVFETDLPEEPGSALGCIACGVSFQLNQRRIAAICGCGTLYFGEKRGVAGRIEFAVDSFPPN